MNKKIYTFTILAILSFDNIVFGSENRTILITAPGQNGMGTDLNYIKHIFGNALIMPLNELEGLNTIYDTGTVEVQPDLGQQRCIDHFDKTIQAQLNNLNVTNIIVYAASQSTATALNWLAQQNKKKTDLSKIKMFISEATLPSGNSAIHHTVKANFSSKLAAIPGAYYVLPYLAKCAFWHYKPAGMQAIHAIADLPNIPMLFLHATKDPQCSYEDAKLFYGALKESGKQNCYFMSFDEYAHIYLLSESNTAKEKFRKIILYEAFKDLDEEHNSDNFTLEQFPKQIDLLKQEFQPEVDKKNIKNFINRENRFAYIDPILKGFLLISTAYCFFKIANRIIKAAKKYFTKDTQVDKNQHPNISLENVVLNKH